MFQVRKNFPKAGNSEKFPMELTSLNPGSTFPIVVMDAENAWVNQLQIWAKGSHELSTGAIKTRGYSA